MKYKLLVDFGILKEGTIIDERDRIEFVILTDKVFYEANPSTFSPVISDDECNKNIKDLPRKLEERSFC